MTPHDDLERDLTRWFEAQATDAGSAGRFQQAIEATRRQRPRPAVLAGLGSAWVDAEPGAVVPRGAWRVIAIAALLIGAIAATAVYVGSQPRRLPAVVGPSVNGLIAYGLDGDIHVGDPITGATTAIVTGPEVDSRPMFSPDGSLIAFQRGDDMGEDPSIVVVRPDGSDARVAMPSGYKRGIGFTWTPDGRELLVNHDSEPSTSTPYFAGELSLVDASGVAEPRLITPPLPRGPGGGYFRAHIAPMFRPPEGDLVLSTAGTLAASLDLWDARLENRTRLIPEGLESFVPFGFSPWDLHWSPDGSRIAFLMGWGNREPDEFGTFVMDADGTNTRRLVGVTAHLAWSPDGSKIASVRGCPDPGRQGAVIVIHVIASGAEHVLEATTVDTKYEGDVSPVPPGGQAGDCFGGWIWEGPGERAWDYEGWSWSPDGQYIVMLERLGTRPMVVDVETGQATELPWVSDSAPSWQRIGGE